MGDPSSPEKGRELAQPQFLFARPLMLLQGMQLPGRYLVFLKARCCGVKLPSCPWRTGGPRSAGFRWASEAWLRRRPAIQQEAIPIDDTGVMFSRVLAIVVSPFRLPNEDLFVQPVMHAAGHVRVECAHRVHGREIGMFAFN
jgi:hypothetical protein